jgi:hypothetical protein
VGTTSLKDIFPRLFQVSEQIKKIVLSKMWRGGLQKELWKDELADDLQIMLNQVLLSCINE